jgi:hypothetical protein
MIARAYPPADLPQNEGKATGERWALNATNNVSEAILRRNARRSPRPIVELRRLESGVVTARGSENLAALGETHDGVDHLL